MRGTLHWDILSLYQGVLDGLRAAGPVTSIGIDSWAIDYGLLDGSGRLIGNPVHYRDERTAGIMERVTAECGADTLYQVGGLQFLPFNTIYQLIAEFAGGPVVARDEGGLDPLHVAGDEHDRQLAARRGPGPC